MLYPQIIEISPYTLEVTTTLLVCVILPMAIVVLLCFLPSMIELKKPLDCGPKLIHSTFKEGFVANGLITPKTTVSPMHLKPAPKLSTLFPAFIVNIEE
jgi:hypothetical protein